MTNLIGVLIDYVEFIEEFDNLRKSNLHDDKVREGEIGSFNFSYHGAGCRLEKEGIVCEFDFLPENQFPIKFSSWKLSEFIRTNPKWNHSSLTLEIIHDELMKIVENKKLFLLEVEGMAFPIFQIKKKELLFE